MNTEATKLWNILNSSLRRDQVLSLLRLGLEADDDGDAASDFEASSGTARSNAPLLWRNERAAISDLVTTFRDDEQLKRGF